MKDKIELTAYAYGCLDLIADLLDGNPSIEELKGLNQEQIVSTCIYYLIACMVTPGIDLEVSALTRAAKMAREVKTGKDAHKMAIDSLNNIMDILREMEDDDDSDE